MLLPLWQSAREKILPTVSKFLLQNCIFYRTKIHRTRGGSRAATTTKMERFVIIVNSFRVNPVKRFILDVTEALDPSLKTALKQPIRIKYLIKQKPQGALAGKQDRTEGSHRRGR